jgi:hypothetical protein
MWQVGDRVEKNGTFKIESKKANANTVTAKKRAGLPATLEQSDIVRIANVAWQQSFTRVDTNKRPSPRVVGEHSITFFWTIQSYKR